MPSYMMQLSYTPEVLAGFIKKPVDRTAVINKLMQKIGGTLVGSWFSFGDYDLVLIIDGSDNVSAAAVSMAVASTGAFKVFKTTPLLGIQEGMEAMKKAGTLGYKPPNAKKK
jgi:uncharacterized protein with GYD domain